MAKLLTLALLWLTTAIAVAMLGVLVLGNSGVPVALLVGVVAGFVLMRMFREDGPRS